MKQEELPLIAYCNGRQRFRNEGLPEKVIRKFTDKYGPYLDYYTGLNNQGTTFTLSPKDKNPYVHSGLNLVVDDKRYELCFGVKDLFESLREEARQHKRNPEVIPDVYLGKLAVYLVGRKKEFDSEETRHKVLEEAMGYAHSATLDYILFDDF